MPKEALRYELSIFVRVFQKYFVAHEWSAVKNSFSTYAWSNVDSCFCEAVQCRSITGSKDMEDPVCGQKWISFFDERDIC